MLVVRESPRLKLERDRDNVNNSINHHEAHDPRRAPDMNKNLSKEFAGDGRRCGLSMELFRFS